MTGMPKHAALIGCGFFARNHMHAWTQTAGIKIVAVCDSDPAKARQMADDFCIPLYFTDAQTMLAEVPLDLVDIATTAESHRALVELAAAHAVPSICQKPMAHTMADAEAMVAACAKAAVPLIIHENFRWQRPFLVMRELIEQGRIGRLQFARFSFRHGYDNYTNQPYLRQIERFAIMDVGLHLFDLARLFMGEVTTLSCTAQHLNPEVRGEDAFTALLQHDGGATSVCDCSFQSLRRPEPFPQTLAEVEGQHGTLCLTEDFSLTLHDQTGRHAIDCAPDIPSWGGKPWHCVQDSVSRFQAHVLDVLNGKAHPQPSGADNLKTLALALASYDAIRQRQSIDMVNWKAPPEE